MPIKKMPRFTLLQYICMLPNLFMEIKRWRLNTNLITTQLTLHKGELLINTTSKF
jgi:hypothetical protein